MERADSHNVAQSLSVLNGPRPSVLNILRKRAEWSRAVESLLRLFATKGDAARKAAAEYGEVYRGRRGAMVFDVVASRQRRYDASLSIGQTMGIGCLVTLAGMACGEPS